MVIQTLSWKVNISFTCFKLTDFISVNKQITIIVIVMQTQAKFCLCFTKINSKIFLRCINTVINIISIPSPTLKNYSSKYRYEMMNYYQY